MEGLRDRSTAITFVVLLIAAIIGGCTQGGHSRLNQKAVGPLEISGGGIAPFKQAGRDNSIEEYGHEGTRRELEQAAATVHAYLIARAYGDWGKACSLSGMILKRQVARLLKVTHSGGGKGCAQRMRRLARGEPKAAPTRYAATEVDAGALRVKGGTAFIFFNANTNGRKLILIRERGAWLVAGLLPTALH
jgi:hypothetical protein